MSSVDQQLSQMLAGNAPTEGDEQAALEEFQTVTPEDIGDEPNAQITELEEALNGLGYDVEPVDGMFDEKTQAAVKQYKKENGMDSPDDPTVTPELMQSVLSAAPQGLSTEEQAPPSGGGGGGEMDMSLGGGM